MSDPVRRSGPAPSGQPDVLVIGGGPAGLAAAIACRRQGLAVEILEARTPPIDKACGEGLMPDAVAALERLGVDMDDVGRPFLGIRYVDDRSDASASFPDRPGRGVRRLELHRILDQHARALGVRTTAARATGLMQASNGVWSVETPAGPRAARWVVGADGLLSRTRRWVGLAGDEPRQPRRFGVRRHLAIAPWSDRVEVWWDRGVEAYVTPVGACQVGVAILWTDPPIAGAEATEQKPVLEHLLSRFPRLAARLDGADRRSNDRGAGPLEHRARDVVSGNLALVGDAAGYVDAITGEGLAVAFAEAEAVAQAVAAENLALYRRGSRRLRRRPEAITRLVLELSRRPRVRARILELLQRRPALFDRLLAVHAGEASPWSPTLATQLGFGLMTRALMPRR